MFSRIGNQEGAILDPEILFSIKLSLCSFVETCIDRLKVICKTVGYMVKLNSLNLAMKLLHVVYVKVQL